MKRGFTILIVGSFLVLFGFSFMILYVSEWFGKMDAPVMHTIEGFDYVVFVIGRFGLILGIIGISIQTSGGIILFIDRKRNL